MAELFAIGSMAGETERGISICSLNTEAQKITRAAAVSKIDQPSWLELDSARHIVYTGGLVHGQGVVQAYDISDPEKPSLLKSLPVSGGESCHQALDEKGEFLALSFYGSGSLSLVRLDENGLPEEECCYILHTGHGPSRERQDRTHIHFARFIGDDVYFCDLGEDRIYEYRLNRAEGTLTDTGKEIRTAPGDGPRHFTYNEAADLLYVVTEMGSNVTVFQRSDGTMLQRISTLPEEVDLKTLPVIDYDAYGAAIHPLGRDRILVSNRGHDSITIFAVKENGLLERLFTGRIHGRIPRDFGIIGDYIICANQTSGDLTVMKLDEDRESFSDTGIRYAVKAPTRILPL